MDGFAGHVMEFLCALKRVQAVNHAGRVRTQPEKARKEFGSSERIIDERDHRCRLTWMILSSRRLLVSRRSPMLGAIGT